jgi:hypothetical protein
LAAGGLDFPVLFDDASAAALAAFAFFATFGGSSAEALAAKATVRRTVYRRPMDGFYACLLSYDDRITTGGTDFPSTSLRRLISIYNFRAAQSFVPGTSI